MFRNTTRADVDLSQPYYYGVTDSAETLDINDIFSKFGTIERYELPAQLSSQLMVSLSAMVLILVLWAALTKIDVVAEAKGELLPSSKIKLVQPAEDGIIERCLVSEGQKVKRGDLLAVLDGTHSSIEYQDRSKEYESCFADLKQRQYAASMLKSVIADPSVLPEQAVDVEGASDVALAVYTTYNNLAESTHDQLIEESYPLGDMGCLKRRLNSLGSQLKSRRQLLSESKKQSAERNAEIAIELKSKQQELLYVKEELESFNSMILKSKKQADDYTKAYQAGVISAVDYLQSQKRQAEEERAIIKTRAQLSKLESELKVLKSKQIQMHSQAISDSCQIDAQIADSRQTIESVGMQVRDCSRKDSAAKTAFNAALSKARAVLAKELVEIKKNRIKLVQLHGSTKKAKYNLNQNELRASIAGIVTKISLRGERQVVKRGETLLTLVPENAKLICQARLSPRDIGFVRKGQPAKLKLDSFPFQDFGVIDGKVIEIEAHTTSSEDKDSEPFYKLKIQPKQNWLMAQGKRIDFTSGASLTAEVVLRQESVLDIVLSPMKKAAQTTWK
ncbi:MAG: HlyD family efflux transporter periplasmic adaptor subunit [Candidatus Obscuribacterales bacterium]|nr:HlyD family efflux transporter periplasmic adaptor subunit [Candidatus Obscuribacterales bacterium]